jgi:hypothetical protein
VHSQRIRRRRRRRRRRKGSQLHIKVPMTKAMKMLIISNLDA